MGQKVNKTLSADLFATHVTNHMNRTRRIFDMPIIRWLICFHKTLRANPRESLPGLERTHQSRWHCYTTSPSKTHTSDAGSDIKVLAGEFEQEWWWISTPGWAAGQGGGSGFGRRSLWRRVSFHRCKDVPALCRPPGKGIYEFAQAWQPAGDQDGRRGGEGLEYQVRRHCYASNSQWKLFFFFALMEKAVWCTAKGIFFLSIFWLLFQ